MSYHAAQAAETSEKQKGCEQSEKEEKYTMVQRLEYGPECKKV